MSETADRIHIEQLVLRARVGVPTDERAEAQRLTVSLTLELRNPIAECRDELERTVDYFAVCERVKAIAASGERRLIETLAEEIAGLILREFTVRAVEVELRKFILPDTACVAVRLRRGN